MTTSDFHCEYKMNAPFTGCKATISVEQSGTNEPVMRYSMDESTNGYHKEGSLTISKDIIKEVRSLVDRHLVALKSTMIPGLVTDTADESFTVSIDGRFHSFKSENIAKMTNDDAVEEAWVLLIKYLPADVKEDSKLIFK